MYISDLELEIELQVLCFKFWTVALSLKQVVLTVLGSFQMCYSPKYSIWYSIKTLLEQREYPLLKYKMFHIQNILHISIKRWTPIKSYSLIYSCIILSTLITLIFIKRHVFIWNLMLSFLLIWIYSHIA